MKMTNQQALEILTVMELDIRTDFPKVTNAERTVLMDRMKALSVSRLAITKCIAEEEANTYDARLNTIKGCTEEIALCNTGIHRLGKLMYGITDTILYYKYQQEKAAYLIRHYKAVNAKSALLARFNADEGLPRIM